MSADPPLSLTEVADRLGVHYMTAYRYVRTGRLPGRQRGTKWEVSESDVRRFENNSTRRGTQRARDASTRSWPTTRLATRLIDGDENGAWAILTEALSGGASPPALYLNLLAPSMKDIGDRWASGAISVADEHRATVIANRLVGRAGPLFRPRGPRSVTIVVGAPQGESHALPTAIAADILRLEGYNVIDVGADVPDASFATCAKDATNLALIAICVSVEHNVTSARTLIQSLRSAGVRTPISLGGAGVKESDARDANADAWTSDVEVLIEVAQAVRQSPFTRRTTPTIGRTRRHTD